jgi:diacylglycerol O-acyltransferase
VRRTGHDAAGPAHPLWQFHLIEDYEGGSAIIARIHHCIGDGIALISVMMSITDGGSDPPQAAQEVRPVTRTPTSRLAGRRRAQAAHRPHRQGHRHVRRAAWQARWTCWPPAAAPAGQLDMARTMGLQVVNDVAALALMPDDSPTLLKGKPPGMKRVAWSEPIRWTRSRPSARCWAARSTTCCWPAWPAPSAPTCATAATRPGRQGDPRHGAGQPAPAGEAWQLGNRFGLAPLVLPVGIANPLERCLRRAPAHEALKGSYQPLLAFAVLAPPAVHQAGAGAMLGLFAKKATAVMTNVPGPRSRCTLRRARMRQPIFWVPAVGRHRRGRVHPQLRRPGAVRPDHRPPAVPDPEASSTASPTNSTSCCG